MDLLKIEEKLDNGEYTEFKDFRNDFRLIVNNCRLYNGQTNGKCFFPFFSLIRTYLIYVFSRIYQNGQQITRFISKGEKQVF